MRNFIVLGIVVLFALATFAATATPVDYKSGDETVHAVLYRPDGTGPFPAIVVIHEYWGLNDWVKDQANKLADQGYVTLAIDLYRGKVAATPDEAHELMRGVPRDRALRDLQAAVAYLKQQRFVDRKRLGAIGWCMGGGYAADLAVNAPDLKAVAINYGALPTDPAAIRKIRPAILGIFGAKDRGISVASVDDFTNAMKKDGKKIEVHIYPDAGHAFENPNNKDGYRADDAADAWQRITAFFKKNL